MSFPLPFVVLSEATLPGALWRGLRGRPMRTVATLALVRPLEGRLARIESWARARGLLGSAYGPPAAIPVHDGYPGDAIHRPYDPAIEQGVRPLVAPFEGHAVLGEYAYAFRKALSDYTQTMLNLTGAAAWAEANLPEGGWRLIGAPPHFARVYALSAGRAPGSWLGPGRAGESPRAYNDAPLSGRAGGRIAAALNALAVFAGMTAWLIARTRLAVAPERFRLAVDRVSPIDLEVAKAADDPAEVLMVERNARLAAETSPELAPYRRVTRNDARATPGVTVRLIARMARELWTLWRDFGDLEAPLFGRFASLIGKRTLFAAFFRRFRPAFLWGRDDYSMDHVIRNQELRKIGGKALGVNHGLPINTYISQWREIDFDVYYAYGRHLYDAFYRAAWPAHMRVEAVGNIQMTPERRARLAAARTKDIAVYAIVTLRFDELLAHVRDLALRFPDRRVHVRMKKRREDSYLRRYGEWLAREAPANVANNDDSDPYDLMLRTAYAVTPGSTAGIEAMQSGAKTFYLDLDPGLRFFYYRNFPHLIVRSAGDIARRIEAIEAGTEAYDFSRSEGLVALSAPDFYAALRRDLGLPPARREAA
ncbi:MAG: hypothetical protein IT564_02955 [Rhodospirillales bacterium]|nr:hypothetical protein [Rhodospirillales bacterium]